MVYIVICDATANNTVWVVLLFWTHALPQGTQAEFRSPLIQTGSILACVPGLDPSLPSEEIGSSDPDLSDSDWTESDFQVIFSNPWRV